VHNFFQSLLPTFMIRFFGGISSGPSQIRFVRCPDPGYFLPQLGDPFLDGFLHRDRLTEL